MCQTREKVTTIILDDYSTIRSLGARTLHAAETKSTTSFDSTASVKPKRILKLNSDAAASFAVGAREERNEKQRREKLYTSGIYVYITGNILLLK